LIGVITYSQEKEAISFLRTDTWEQHRNHVLRLH